MLKLADEERGLVLVTGITGSGKSTTLAAMIDYINAKRACHIVTIEDPIEYAFRDQRSVINQREIGFDTNSFAKALRAALRQDPDVILVGEMRDLETAEIAHDRGRDRPPGALDPAHHRRGRDGQPHHLDVPAAPAAAGPAAARAASCKGVISQRLVAARRRQGHGARPSRSWSAPRASASSSRIRQRTREIHDAIAQRPRPLRHDAASTSRLTELVRSRTVTYDEALSHASNPDDFALHFRGVAGSTDESWHATTGYQPPTAAQSRNADVGTNNELQIERFDGHDK